MLQQSPRREREARRVSEQGRVGELGHVNARVPGGQVGGCDAFLSLFPDQDGFVSELCAGHVGHIDHDHIHANATNAWCGFTIDDNGSAVFHAPWIAIAVTDADCADQHILRAMPDTAIANAFAF